MAPRNIAAMQVFSGCSPTCTWEVLDMKVTVIAAALSLAAFSASADDRLVRFEGGFGVVPTRANAAPNIVRGVNPGGVPWVISRLSADIRADGSISVDGRGLLLGGTNNIGFVGANNAL